MRPARRVSERRRRRQGEDSNGPASPDFALIFASPLLDHKRRPLALLDIASEMNEVFGALRRSERKLHCVSATATARNLRTLLTDGVVVLHYCGHGLLREGSDNPALPPDEENDPFCLVLEDDCGGTHLLPAREIEAFVSAGRGHMLQLVFMSACHSRGGGEAFVRAGVPHVVAVKRKERIQDRAAAIFAEAFYYALLRGGKTVRQAFDIGSSAVATAHGLAEAHSEAGKFVLLPAEDDHDVQILSTLRGGAMYNSSPRPPPNNLPAFFPMQFIGRHAQWHALTATQRRLSCVYGDSGVGKSALCLAAAYRMVERRRFPAGVLHVALATAASRSDLVHSVLAALEDVGLRSRKASTVPECLSALADALRGDEALLILDDVEPLLRTGYGRQAVRELVVGALAKLPELRVVMSCQYLLPIHSSQSEIELPALNPTDSARLFIAHAPRSLTFIEVFDGLPPQQALQQEVAIAARLLGTSSAQASVLRDGRLVWQLESPQLAERLEALLATSDECALSLFSREGSQVHCRAHVSRRLARHPVLTIAGGNPTAISLLARCVAPQGAPRTLRQLQRMLEGASGLALSPQPDGAPPSTSHAEGGVTDPLPADVLHAATALSALRRSWKEPREPSPPPPPEKERSPPPPRGLARLAALWAASPLSPTHWLLLCIVQLLFLLLNRIPGLSTPPAAERTVQSSPLAARPSLGALSILETVLITLLSAGAVLALVRSSSPPPAHHEGPIPPSPPPARHEAEPQQRRSRRVSRREADVRQCAAGRSSSSSDEAPRRDERPPAASPSRREFRRAHSYSCDRLGERQGVAEGAASFSSSAPRLRRTVSPAASFPRSRAATEVVDARLGHERGRSSTLPLLAPPMSLAPSTGSRPVADQQLPPSSLLTSLVNVFEGARGFSHRILPLLKPLIVERGDLIVRAGELGDEMYFITSGKVEVLLTNGEEIYATRCEGDFFGEVACLQESDFVERGYYRRTASVRACCRCQLWSLSRTDLLQHLEDFPLVRDTIMRTGSSRMQQTSTWLGLGTLFGDLIRDSDRGAFFAHLAPRMQPVRRQKGYHLIRQGETNDDLFFLIQGEVEVVKEHLGQLQVLGRRTPVAFFGEIAALGLTKACRSASVVCVEDCLLYVVQAPKLQEVLHMFPSISEQIHCVAYQRFHAHPPTRMAEAEVEPESLEMLDDLEMNQVDGMLSSRRSNGSLSADLTALDTLQEIRLAREMSEQTVRALEHQLENERHKCRILSSVEACMVQQRKSLSGTWGHPEGVRTVVAGQSSETMALSLHGGPSTNTDGEMKGM
ncbi:hypothetical protein AB1Y20_002027 [Prymnesium parvum]|uniref:Cyclic nucleotide-binding domain-containing protein n=1 Tax=Prymnesium parvum TaxID=97485 RepID=A0AB34J7X4_PRYPA